MPFFYCSGSEFDEMFVGVGAKRVRELFGESLLTPSCLLLTLSFPFFLAHSQCQEEVTLHHLH